MIRAFAFYFPQFYAIAENNEWWGSGFTDWDLVRKAKPIGGGQIQPRVPLDGYHDQSDPAVIVSQARLLKQYGLSGFNFYHYWFDGRVLLDAPVNNLLSNGAIDIEYVLTWANESWTRQWVGRPNDYLIKQMYSSIREEVRNHYNYLRPFFSDSRYLKVNRSPVFCVYRPELIPNFVLMQDQMSEFARKDGFTGIHFLACRSYDVSNAEALYSSFDGIINFNPRYALNSVLRTTSSYRLFLEKVLRQLPERAQSMLVGMFRRNASFQSYEYSAFLASLDEQCKNSSSSLPVYPCVFPDWDNTARYGEKATFFTGSSPELFASAVKASCDSLQDHHRKWFFINAWNEWSEAAYLEPDEKNGLAYLSALQAVLATYNR